MGELNMSEEELEYWLNVVLEEHEEVNKEDT